MEVGVVPADKAEEVLWVAGIGTAIVRLTKSRPDWADV